MGKKKTFIIDIEAIGLNGPGMLRDIDIRNAINVAEEIKEQLKIEGIRAQDITAIPPGYFDSKFHPTGYIPKSVDLMKFVDDFTGVVIPHNTNTHLPRVYDKNDVHKSTMHDKSSDDFINGDIKHMLWGKPHYEEAGVEIIKGEYYWVKVREELPWVMAEVVNKENEDGLYFELNGLYAVLSDVVYDYVHIEKPQ